MNEIPVKDRRPLKTRSWPIFRWLASWLANHGVTPNGISIASVVFACLGAAALVATGRLEDGISIRFAWLLAGVGIQLRLIANLLDGMVAVEGGKASPTGPLYNEVPDRISDPVLLIAAGYAIMSDPIAGWAAACGALLVAYVRAIAASVGAGQPFLGPMAKQQRMAILTLLCVCGVVLPTDWMGIGVVGLTQIVLWIIVAGCAVTVVRRLRFTANFLRLSAEMR